MEGAAQFARLIARVLLAALAYIFGVVLTGALAPVLHLPVIHAVPGMNPQKSFLLLFFAAPLLILSLLPLNAGLRGRWLGRWFALGLLLFVTISLNTMIELKIFSDMLPGSPLAASYYGLLPCLLATAILVFPFGKVKDAPAIGRFSAVGWLWRLLLAWATYPACYWVFGMMVAPFVMAHYRAGELGLRIPMPGLILRTELLRSALFLAASFPAVLLWRNSRGQFILAMGLAQAFAAGAFQLLQAYFLPTVMRVAHSIEIAADAFAYTAVLGLLFISSARAAAPRAREAATTAS